MSLRTPSQSVSHKQFHHCVNHKKKLSLRHPLPTFGISSFCQAFLWLGVDKVLQNLIKVSSDIYYNVASWFPGNVRIKPHFNTQWGKEPLQFLKILHTFEGHHRQLLQQWHQPQCWPSMHLKIVFLMSLMNQRSTRRLWQRPMLILPPLHLKLNLRRSFWLKVLLTNYGNIHILFNIQYTITNPTIV